MALFFAFAWRRLLVAATRGPRAPAPPVADRCTPADHALSRSRGAPHPDILAVGTLAAKIAPLELAVSEDAPTRVNILIPTIDLDHFFGGYIAQAEPAATARGRGARVRIVTVDPVGLLPSSWQRSVEAYSGLDGLFERVEVVFGRESNGIEVSRSDRFVATTWWTAHIAARRRHAGSEAERFLYLIQEYEPFTFPMGSYAALAQRSYGFPHSALFSSELLRDWFRRHGIGVYAEGAPAGDRAPPCSRTPSRRWSRPPPRSWPGAATPAAPLLRAARATRRAQHVRAGDARPEPAVLDGMFEDWELYGIGTVKTQQRLKLGHGHARAPSAPRAGRLRRAPARARCRAGAHVHAASEPCPDRDGVGGDDDGYEQLREQDARGDGGDLHQPHHRRPEHRGASRPGSGRPSAEPRFRGPRPRRRVSWSRSIGATPSTTSSMARLEGLLGPPVSTRPYPAF